MRVELALILGIVFFCCWCAYIVAQMNASVSVGNSTNYNHNADSQAQYSNSHASRQHLQQQVTWAPVVGEPPPSPPQATTAAAVATTSDRLANHYNELQPFIGAPDYDRPPLRSLPTSANSSLNSNIGPYYATNHNYRQQFARQQEASSPPAALVQPANHQANYNQPIQPFNYNQQQVPHWLLVNNAPQPQVSTGDETGDNADEQEEDEQPGQQQQEVTADEQSASSSEQQDEPDDAQQPKSELEEVAKRRSFDETQYDSNERGPDGTLLKTKRRHLINGRPVEMFSSSPSSAESSRQVPTSLTNDSDEFERLVDEIDSERTKNNDGNGDGNSDGDGDGSADDDAAQEPEEQDNPTEELEGNATAKPGEIVAADRRQDVSSQQQQQQSGGPNRNATSLVAPQTTNRQLSQPLPQTAPPSTKRTNSIKSKSKHRKPNDSHEHRMHESLTAQQWDDDSSSKSPSNGPGQADADDDESAAEEESRRLEELSNDLLLNNNGGQQQQADESASPVAFDRGLERTRRRRRDVELEIDKEAEVGSPNQADNISTSNISNVVHYDDEAEYAKFPLGGEEAVQLIPKAAEIQANNSSGQQAGVPNGSGVRKLIDNRSDYVNISIGPFKPNRSLDSISGQEDISIEVLANPPQVSPLGLPPPLADPLAGPQTQQSQTHLYRPTSAGYPSLGPSYQLQTVVPTQQVVGPPPLQISLGQANAMGGSFPQVDSPFASGSSKKVTKKKKKKKKLSKMSNSKYKAAKAYEAKMKSKKKKGNMYKKKKKSHKNLKAAKKHFAGSVKGKKSAHGYGHKGADKGENFFKDKGYKKRGFKKVYHKLETGDHKTYFDEFRDKDHNKKWKKFDDKHKYSKKKKWSGNDLRHTNHHKLDESRGKSSKDGRWKEKSSSKHAKKAHKLKKSKKAEDSGGFKTKKKKTKTTKE